MSALQACVSSQLTLGLHKSEATSTEMEVVPVISTWVQQLQMQPKLSVCLCVCLSVCVSVCVCACVCAYVYAYLVESLIAWICTFFCVIVLYVQS